MGDRIAILQEGGKLAQYAPPAELLGARPTRSSRTSSAPTARSSAWRSCACATSTCGGRRWCARASRARRAPDRDADLRTRCWSTTTAARSAGCRSARSRRARAEQLRSRRAGRRARRRPCATRCPTCSQPGPARPGRRRAAARVVGVLVDGGHPRLARPSAIVAQAVRRDRRRVLAQSRSVIRDRRSSDSCVADNGFCPDWIADNLDRYSTPLLEHIELTLVSRRHRLRDRVRARAARPPAALADRADHPDHRDPLHDAERRASSSCCCRSPGRGNTTAMIALVAYTLLIIFRNISRAWTACPPRRATPAAAWA